MSILKSKKCGLPLLSFTACLLGGGLVESKVLRGLQQMPADAVVCLTAEQCEEKFNSLNWDGYFYADDSFPTKGCFSKNNNGNLYFGTGGSVAEMSEANVQGLQERVWCDVQADAPTAPVTDTPSKQPTLSPVTDSPTTNQPTVDTSTESPTIPMITEITLTTEHDMISEITLTTEKEPLIQNEVLLEPTPSPTKETSIPITTTEPVEDALPTFSPTLLPSKNPTVTTKSVEPTVSSTADILSVEPTLSSTVDIISAAPTIAAGTEDEAMDLPTFSPTLIPTISSKVASIIDVEQNELVSADEMLIDFFDDDNAEEEEEDFMEKEEVLDASQSQLETGLSLPMNVWEMEMSIPMPEELMMEMSMPPMGISEMSMPSMELLEMSMPIGDESSTEDYLVTGDESVVVVGDSNDTSDNTTQQEESESDTTSDQDEIEEEANEVNNDTQGTAADDEDLSFTENKLDANAGTASEMNESSDSVSGVHLWAPIGVALGMLALLVTMYVVKQARRRKYQREHDDGAFPGGAIDDSPPVPAIPVWGSEGIEVSDEEDNGVHGVWPDVQAEEMSYDDEEGLDQVETFPTDNREESVSGGNGYASPGMLACNDQGPTVVDDDSILDTFGQGQRDSDSLEKDSVAASALTKPDEGCDNMINFCV